MPWREAEGRRGEGRKELMHVDGGWELLSNRKTHKPIPLPKNLPAQAAQPALKAVGGSIPQGGAAKG